MDGNVGPVGGMPEKAEAVEDAGAELFLTPQSEVEQAQRMEGLTVRGSTGCSTPFASWPGRARQPDRPRQTRRAG